MELELKDWYKPTVDRKSLKEISKRKDWPGLLHFFIYFSSLFLCGYFAYLTWGTWWTVLWLFLYGSIHQFSVSNWHETVHRTAFKTRWVNEIFYYISCFMADMEPFRWRWSHTFHHTNTLQTKDYYDYEIQVSRPTELIWFFLNFVPFSDFLYPSRLLKFEIIKHAFGNLTEVVKISAPDSQKRKIIWTSRLYVLIWLLIIFFSIYYATILPILFFIIPNNYGKPIWFTVNVSQHLGAAIDTKDHRKSTYSVKINPILSFYYWHMEYHVEHHMFPMVPSYNLKKLQNSIKDQVPKPFSSLFAFYKEVLPVVIKQATNPDHYYQTDSSKTKS